MTPSILLALDSIWAILSNYTNLKLKRNKLSKIPKSVKILGLLNGDLSLGFLNGKNAAGRQN